MAIPTLPGNKHSVQNILNWSFDEENKVLAIILVAEDADNPGTLVRVQGQYDANGVFSLLTRTYSIIFNRISENGNQRLSESNLLRTTE